MGSFFIAGQTTLLTRKRENANESNGALAALIGTRVAVFLEPGSKDTIQADTLKLISGGDEMSVRANYSKQIVFKPTFKTIIVCNDKPRLSEDSFAIWRRIRVIDWPVTFSDTPDDSNPYEAKLDPLLEEKVKRWPPFFVGLMVYWLEQYRSEGLAEPSSVLQHTNEYKEEHDDWKRFRDIYLNKSQDVCGSTRLKTAFKVWFEKQFGKDAKLPLDRVVHAYFEKHLGGKSKNHHLESGGTLYGWKGWKLLNPDTQSSTTFLEDCL